MSNPISADGTSSADTGDNVSATAGIGDRYRIVLLSHKDTDILTLSSAREMLPLDFPPIETVDLCGLKSDDDMLDVVNDKVTTDDASQAIIVVRLLGRGVPGFQHLIDRVHRNDQDHLIVVSGIPGSFEPDLTAMCHNVSVDTINEVMKYFSADGCATNMSNLLKYLADHLWKFGFGYDAAIGMPDHGLYHPRYDGVGEAEAYLKERAGGSDRPTVAVVFYRCHYLSGNTAFVDALIDELEILDVNAVGLFTETLRAHEPIDNVNGHAVERFPTALTYLLDDDSASGGRNCVVDVLISSMAFATGEVNPDGPTLGSWSSEGLRALNVPVLQAINSVGTYESWMESSRGLNPLDTAMNVAIPEFDGRIITLPISFMAPVDETNSVQYYEPVADRVEQVAKQAARLATLRHKPNEKKRVAFMLTNSSGKAERIGDAVGLDTPASIMKVFEAMRAVGYDFGDDSGDGDGSLPSDGDKLIQSLVDRCSYDEIYLTEDQLANAAGHVSAETYQTMFDKLPRSQRDRMTSQWGEPPGKAYVHDDAIALAGLEYGNVFVALQPPRGYGMDPDKIYHTPDLPPPHNYYALYCWLRDVWKADAIVHMGKHGTLEWLPGKGVGLSKECYPDTFLDDMPLVYPFIINDPGEGMQSKRRAHSVIIDHLTPPMTTADGYGELGQLMQLVDEYYQIEMLDPTKLPLIQKQILELIEKINLDEDMSFLLNHDHDHGHHSDHHDCEQEAEEDKCQIVDEQNSSSMNRLLFRYSPAVRHDHHHDHEVECSKGPDGFEGALAKMDGKDFAHLIEDMDGYLCELAGAQIRDGLHILGKVPEGDTLVDMLQALTRLSNLDIPSIRDAIAAMFGLDASELLGNQGARVYNIPPILVRLADRPLATAGDAIETIDDLAKHIFALMVDQGFDIGSIPDVIDQTFPHLGEVEVSDIVATLEFVCGSIVPSLCNTTQEITNLIHALHGEFVPAGPSGSPTRGLAHLLPTGRNFYACDPQTLPSLAAWEVGQGLANACLDRYFTETGAYPEHVAISVWGTAAMRTHGDDIAQIFSLLGIRPVWQQENHRVTGVELIPLSELGRPRIDVTVRISGFFRDAFPHLITLMDKAVNMAINADEPLDQNFIRKHYLHDLANEQNEESARYRVFGCPPGAYGIGILDLIEAQNWKDESDFAECYVNWGGYAYCESSPEGIEAKAQFTHRLTTVEVAIHNQDDREHDIFDSDDYFQFHGGMIATIKALSGKKPKGYFGDTQNPAAPKVRDINEETLRVYRTRVVNPKWLESIKQHGYKGASEMAATVDYLFGFDATADVVSDFMYEKVAQSYALDKATQEFYEQSNPWALRGIAERLLEAAQRGMWAEPNADTLEDLRHTLLRSDAMLEGRSDPA